MNKVTTMTFDKAIELGEYQPEYLAGFPEWHELSRHVQFQYVKKALENRHKQLVQQYAELSNVLDYRNKPSVKDALKNIDKRIHDLLEEKERLFIEYSDA